MYTVTKFHVHGHLGELHPCLNLCHVYIKIDGGGIGYCKWYYRGSGYYKPKNRVDMSDLVGTTSSFFCRRDIHFCCLGGFCELHK